MALSLEDKFDEVRQLLVIGKEKGYLLYDEVNDLLPADLTANPEDLEELQLELKARSQQARS